MKISLQTIKAAFKTGKKPKQLQFWNTFDSFWHKDEKLPFNSISGLLDLLARVQTLEGSTPEGTVTEGQLTEILKEYYNKQEDIPIEKIKGILAYVKQDDLAVFLQNYYNKDNKIPVSEIDGIEKYNMQHTAFVSKQGNDETGEVGVIGKPFATFMGALAKVPDGCENYTIWYHSDNFVENFFENNIDLSNGGTSLLRYLNVVIPKNIKICCNSNKNRSLFQAEVNSIRTLLTVTGLNGEGGSLYRAGSPSETDNSHIFGLNGNNYFGYKIKDLNEVINHTTGFVGNAFCNEISNVKSIVCNGSYAFAYCANIIFEDVNMVNNVGGIFNIAIPKKIINCRLEAQEFITNSWQISTDFQDCVLKIHNGLFLFRNASYNQVIKPITFENCKFLNYSDSPNSGIMRADTVHTPYFNNCIFYQKNTNKPHLHYSFGIIKMKDCIGNGGMNFCNSQSQPSKYYFYIKDLNAIQVGDEYDLWMMPLSCNFHHSILDGKVKLTYLVQDGDGENEIINGLISLWNEKVAEGNRLFIGGKDGFTVANEFLNISTPVLGYADRHCLVIAANSVYDWLPGIGQNNYGMCPDNKNFLINEGKNIYQSGTFNVLDVDNEYNSYRQIPYVDYNHYSEPNENNNIIYEQ